MISSVNGLGSNPNGINKKLKRLSARDSKNINVVFYTTMISFENVPSMRDTCNGVLRRLGDAVKQAEQAEEEVTSIAVDGDPKIMIEKVELKMSSLQRMGKVTYNGYVTFAKTHPAASMSEGGLTMSSCEDITYHHSETNGSVTVGFDTLHIYNHVPDGVSELRYTHERLVRFLEGFCAGSGMQFPDSVHYCQQMSQDGRTKRMRCVVLRSVLGSVLGCVVGLAIVRCKPYRRAD